MFYKYLIRSLVPHQEWLQCKCVIVIPFSLEECSWFVLAAHTQAVLIPDEIGSCFLTKQIHSLLYLFLCTHIALIILLHMVLYTHSNAQINGRAALMRFHIYSCQINCVGMCPFFLQYSDCMSIQQHRHGMDGEASSYEE